MIEAIGNRYEFIIIFDVENGNPNGDPDAGGSPRIDPETGCGLVTDVCLKRKIRDYVLAKKEMADGFDIYIKKDVTLNSNDLKALSAEGIEEETDEKLATAIKEAKKNDPGLDARLRDFMCHEFYDVRTFGAVMTTFTKNNLNCGQVRGPVQMTFARSVEPIFPMDVTLTRVAITKEEDAEKKQTEFGGKYIVPYGLYVCKGFISANLARKVTGFSDEDLNLLWEAIKNMFELDRAASRGNMCVRELIIFKHDNELGCAPAQDLFDLVKVSRAEGSEGPARKYSDYTITIDKDHIPAGVTCIQK